MPLAQRQGRRAGVLECDAGTAAAHAWPGLRRYTPTPRTSRLEWRLDCRQRAGTLAPCRDWPPSARATSIPAPAPIFTPSPATATRSPSKPHRCSLHASSGLPTGARASAALRVSCSPRPRSTSRRIGRMLISKLKMRRAIAPGRMCCNRR